MNESHDQDTRLRVSVEPLTHGNAEGTVYQRDVAVERQIAEALGLSSDDLLRRAAILDQDADGYLKEECLVCLIRHIHRGGNRPMVNGIAEALIRHCAGFIEGRLRRLGPEPARDGYSDVIERLFDPILDLSSDRSDFLQVRFWPALEKLVVRAFNQQLVLLKRAQATVPLSSIAGYERQEDEEHARVLRPPADTASTSASDEDVIRSDLIREALSRIDEPFRSAFVLRHYFHWPIEDQNPTVHTISRHFGKDPRTIQNWLKKAEASLKTWRGEMQ